MNLGSVLYRHVLREPGAVAIVDGIQGARSEIGMKISAPLPVDCSFVG